MEEKLREIAKLTQKFRIVIPPGPYDDYPKSGITYLVEQNGGNESIADNPYIIEYLLFNKKEEWIQDVSHMLYLGHQAMQASISSSSFYVFFNESILHFLDFPIEREELPVFKIFLDYLAHLRKDNTTDLSKGSFFPWKLDTFCKYGQNVSHSLSEQDIINLHRRLCEFQQVSFPREALTNLFNR